MSISASVWKKVQKTKDGLMDRLTGQKHYNLRNFAAWGIIRYSVLIKVLTISSQQREGSIFLEKKIFQI